MSSSRSRSWKKPVLAILVVAVVAASSAGYYLASQTHGSTSTCDSVIPQDSPFKESGFAQVCGIGLASDGRLTIAVHNSLFLQEKDIPFRFASYQQTPLPAEVFLLVNVTIRNVGGGNTDVGAGFQAAVLNGSSYVDTTQFIANASFTGMHPNQTIPNYMRGGGVYLPPGSRVDLWLIFYVPFPRVLDSNIVEASNFRLQLVTYSEFGYGGTYVGNGGYNCQKVACQDTHVEFVVAA